MNEPANDHEITLQAMRSIAWSAFAAAGLARTPPGTTETELVERAAKAADMMLRQFERRFDFVKLIAATR